MVILYKNGVRISIFREDDSEYCYEDTVMTITYGITIMDKPTIVLLVEKWE